MKTVTAQELHRRLGGTSEIALLDAREQGVHLKGHPFFASSARDWAMPKSPFQPIARQISPLAISLM